jgi:hypothetical protein
LVAVQLQNHKFAKNHFPIPCCSAFINSIFHAAIVARREIILNVCKNYAGAMAGLTRLALNLRLCRWIKAAGRDFYPPPGLASSQD